MYPASRQLWQLNGQVPGICPTSSTRTGYILADSNFAFNGPYQWRKDIGYYAEMDGFRNAGIAMKVLPL
jgi:hypothetical protein